MDNNIIQIPFSSVIEKIPAIKHYNDDILLIDDTCTRQNIDQPFRHPFKLDGILIGVVKKGNAVISINLKQFELKSGQIFICSQGDIIQFISSDIEEVSNLAISLDYILSLNVKLKVRDFVADIVTRFNNPIFDLPFQYIDEVESLYQLISKNITQGGICQKELLKSLCTSYLYLIIQIFSENQKSLSEAKEGVSQRSMSVFMRFMELLDEYHQRERSVTFYADKLHLTPKHLSFLIKKVSGTIVTDWINRYVILEAKSLLMYSDKSIQEIAYSLNFPNPSFFGKYFKRHTGMSPGDYRTL